MPKLLQVGLVGVGRWGRVYLQTLLRLPERYRLTHLVTRHPEHAALLPSPVTVLSDWRKLVQSTCDVVIIATPAQTHAEILMACVKAGTPCIVEKPLCMDVAIAKELDQQVRAHTVPVLVNHIHLFDPAYQSLKRALEHSGEPIRLVVCEMLSFGPFRSDTSALWDWGPHVLSLCLDLLGNHPERIEAYAGLRTPDGSPEAMNLHYEIAGACVWIQINRAAPQRRRTLGVWTTQHYYCYDLDDLAAQRLCVTPVNFARRYDLEPSPTGAQTLLPPISAQRPLASMLTYFADGLEGHDRRHFGTGVALELTRLLAQCEEAMRHST